MSKKNIADLFKKSGGSIGLDDESSDIIIQNLNAGTIPMCVGSPFTAEEEETDQFKIILPIFDASGSMDDVEQILIDEFNETLVPALMEGAKNIVGGIRMGGLVFGSDVRALWGGGFFPLADVPKLTRKEYRANGATSLYQAVLDGITGATAYALDIRNKTGTNPEVVVIVMSDGANNQFPYDPDDVYKITSKLSKELFTLVFAGFETFENVDFKDIAKAIGFPEVFEMKMAPGETTEDRKRRFRHMIGVMSSSLVGHVSKTVVRSNSQSGGFWQNP